MAFEVQKINPLDLQPRKAVGISLPFSGQAVFNSNYTTRDAIKNNLINYFLTAKGERFLNVNFGNSLQNLLFEQLTEDMLPAIDAAVREDLRIYFPTIQVIEIVTEGVPDRNIIQFSMRYRVVDTNIEDELIINFEQ